jgi:hypothetical protein
MGEPKRTWVHCCWCGDRFEILIERLRELTDRSQKPECFGCTGIDPVNGKDELGTASNQMLLAAGEAAGEFTFSALVMACWRRFPARYALKRHPEHCDSHRVAMELPKMMSKRYFVKVRPCVYRITDMGKAKLELLRKRRQSRQKGAQPHAGNARLPDQRQSAP